ncbi:MAG: tetratricopeptide repeat protein [Ignavibacteria bacterium]|nr:tetratricopeptide repeat protein [Ignavibacteria bacterium]
MNKHFIFILTLMFMWLTFSAYQCASTEITSARLYIQQKNYDKAEEVLKKEVTKNPQSEEGWYLTGYVKHEKRDYNGMLEAFQNALKIGKKYEREINQLLKASWAENFNDGVNYFNSANRASNPDTVKILRQKAINAFETAIKMQPDSNDTYRNLVFVYLSANDLDGSLEPSERWVKRVKSLESYQIITEIYYTKAEQQWMKYQSTKNPQDSVKAMDLYFQTEKYASEGLQKYPNDGTLNSFLFNTYVSLGKRDLALKKAKEAVDLNPNDKFTNYNYGTMLLEARNYEEAVKYFKKALEIDPKYENAIYNIAACYINWGIQVREKEEEANATTRTYKKYFEDAKNYLEQLVELTPNDFKTWERLGQVYAVLGMKEKAEQAFNKADELRK